MASIDLTPREKICCFTYFFTPELNFSACSKKTSRFLLNRLDYLVIFIYFQKQLTSLRRTLVASLSLEMLQNNNETILYIMKFSLLFNE